MDNSNTCINQEEVWLDEYIIPSELIKKENDTINPASMEVDGIAPSAAEVQNYILNPANGKPSNFKACMHCEIIIRRNNILQSIRNGELSYFCSEKCLNLNLYRTLPRLFYPRPVVQPQPSPSPSTTMKITLAASLYVRVCCSCSSIIQINYCSNISWQARDFCNEKCLTKHQMKLISYCMECKCLISDVNNFSKFSMLFGNKTRAFCTKTCVDKYKISLEMCQFCNNDILADAKQKYLSPVTDHSTTVKQFCSIGCVKNYYQFTLNIPHESEADSFAKCVVCKAFTFVKVKFQYDDILTFTFCSEICFGKFQYINKQDVLQCYICKVLYDKSFLHKYCLYDNNVKNFCSQNCQTIYYITVRKIVECSSCKMKKFNFDMIQKTFPNNQTIYACSFHCLKNSYLNRLRPILNSASQNKLKRLNTSFKKLMTRSIARNEALSNKKNASTVCYPILKDAFTSTESNTENKHTETTNKNVNEFSSAIVPTPVPINVPALVPLDKTPVPVPIPIPIPIFIPTDCRMIEEVIAKMKKIKEELPQDPLQAELTMLAKSLDDSKTEVEVKKPLPKSKPKPKLKSRLKKTVKRNVVKKNFSFGFNTLKRWIVATNAQIQNDSSNPKLESKSNLIKNNLLFMTRDELHKCLVAFLKEIKGACSTETIYKIFLDVQKYLLQNKKQEYIFLDPSFKIFIEDFNEITISFHNSFKINLKLTEEYLWKTNQLGIHTPYVLLNSLIYFNLKLFGLKTVQEHLSLLSKQITFVKKPKLNVPHIKSNYVYHLKYFPVINYECGKNFSEMDKQIFNEKLCPGYLYELYFKKCPTSAEHGNKSFYLKPELAFEIDSSIWFSNQTLDVWTIEMMLNRIKMVKEINEI